MTISKTLIALALIPCFLQAQSTTVSFSGVVRAANGLALPESTVRVYDDMLKKQIAEIKTDAEGRYDLSVAKLGRFRLMAEKATYFEQDTILSPTQTDVSIDFQLTGKPGYVFDVTMFDKAYEHNPINTLRDCKVEIYNNSTREQELAIERLPKSTFNFAFAEGNHYTMLVRKPGYLNRRVEVFVNVNGCILCVDGMGMSEPDLVPLMQHGNETGYFLGTLDLDSIQIGKRFQLNNIYYDFDKWDIRPEAAKTLDKLAGFLMDNPQIKVELGSHTDMRGADEYNLTLSDKRAEAAVQYLTSVRGIDPDRITHKGYGETQLVAANAHTEQEHQLNRRTEIKITGITDRDPLWDKSLKQIIEDPQLYRKVIDQEKSQKSLTGRTK